VKFTKLIIIPFLLLVIMLLLSCELLLGPEPDTSPQGILYNLWNDFNNIYAYMDIRMSENVRFNDWHDVYYNPLDGYSRRIGPYTTEGSLFNVCVNMLRELNDSHVVLYMPGRNENSYVDNSDYFRLDAIKELLKDGGSDKYKNFYYGTVNLPDVSSNIGYIYIIGFTEENTDPMIQTWGRSIDDIIIDLAHTDALVLDVRANRGGHVYIMEYIAARFTSEPKEYLLASNKNGPGPYDFQPIKTHIIKPAHIRYTKPDIKPIILLTNNDTVSVSERFTIALRTQKNVVHMGTSTRGALSVRIERPMVNGWFYSISSERVTDMNGVVYEGRGISPDAEYIVEYGIEYGRDEQIRSAIALADKLSSNQ